MDIPDRKARVIALLEDCVLAELEVTNAGLELGLDELTIARLADGVTAGVLYGFSVDWAPIGCATATLMPGRIRAAGSRAAETASSTHRRACTSRSRGLGARPRGRH